MDPKTPDYFARIIALAQATFEHVEYTTDTTPKRIILRLQATYGQYRVFVLSCAAMVYGNISTTCYAEIGLKPGSIILLTRGRFASNTDGLARNTRENTVPHLHRHNKTERSLTEEMTFEVFVNWLKATIQPA